jgi:hypothetical protein
MLLNPPEWLSRRGGSLRPGIDSDSWVVMFDHQPQYILKPIPAKGKYSYELMQSINGRRLDNSGIYSSAEEAVQAGLEELRKVLGW